MMKLYENWKDLAKMGFNHWTKQEILEFLEA